MARITALLYNWWWGLFVRLADPDQHTEAIPLPPAAVACPSPPDPPRRTDPHHHQPPPCQGRLGPGSLPRHRRVLQDPAPNCGAVDAPAALVRRALPCPDEIPRGAPVTRTARAPRAVVDDSSLPARASRGRKTARDGAQLPFLGSAAAAACASYYAARPGSRRRTSSPAPTPTCRWAWIFSCRLALHARGCRLRFRAAGDQSRDRDLEHGAELRAGARPLGHVRQDRRDSPLHLAVGIG